MSSEKVIAYPFFTAIQKRCKELIESKYEQYQNSWVENKNLDREWWHKRLFKEVQEWYPSKNLHSSQKEILDVIIIACMIYTLETIHKKALTNRRKKYIA